MAQKYLTLMKEYFGELLFDIVITQNLDSIKNYIYWVFNNVMC